MAQTEFERGWIAGSTEMQRIIAFRILDTKIAVPKGEQKELS